VNRRKGRASGRAVHGAHAKTLGVVKAEVEILGYVPAPYAQGIYAKPGRHGALIRFSSASNHLGPDAQLGPTSADEVLPLPKRPEWTSDERQ
jgi:hypothetical protein